MGNKPDELIPTRWALITKLKNWDDQESWREFFDTYWKLIFGVAIKAGLTPTEAEDVVQETVMSVCKHIKQFRADPAFGSFKSWLLRMTKWRIADQLRKRLPANPHSDRRPEDTSRTSTAERVPDPASLNLDAAWEDEWQKNLFDAALESVKKEVSPEQYQMFDYYVLRNWPVTKVASTLQVTARQIYLAKHRISKLMKKELKALEKKTP